MKRSSFLDHVAWTGLGMAFTLGAAGTFEPVAADARTAGPTFVQISDSHIGFHQAANPDVTATLERAVDAINAMPQQPHFVVHTGDVTHLSTPAQFDTARSILGKLRAPLVVLPGEHDVIGDATAYFAAFARSDAPKGWYAWDRDGVHYISLVNVFAFEKMGVLGTEQLDWLENDLRDRKSDTPIVVFGHVPLYALYEPWGWTTADGAKALAMLARFDAVTVFNGHIHQVIAHTDGNLKFYTAHSTAYPQPAPGTAEKPGPLVVPPDSLLGALGYRSVTVDRSATVDRAAATVDERTLV